MTSRTGAVRSIRKAKKAAQGRIRKNALRNNGSTAPDLKLDKPNANERAQMAKAKKK